MGDGVHRGFCGDPASRCACAAAIRCYSRRRCFVPRLFLFPAFVWLVLLVSAVVSASDALSSDPFAASVAVRRRQFQAVRGTPRSGLAHYATLPRSLVSGPGQHSGALGLDRGLRPVGKDAAAFGRTDAAVESAGSIPSKTATAPGALFPIRGSSASASRTRPCRSKPRSRTPGTQEIREFDVVPPRRGHHHGALARTVPSTLRAQRS